MCTDYAFGTFHYSCGFLILYFSAHICSISEISAISSGVGPSYHVHVSKHQETPFLPSSLLSKQGLERYFRPDACMLGIPKPFESHFV